MQTVDINADVYRSDVNSAKKVTGSHGFERYITVPKGTYYVEVYAIDITGEVTTKLPRASSASNNTVTVTEDPYNITYDANGGSGAPDAQQKGENVQLTLSGAEPTREGYTFAGWNTAQDGSGDSYAPGATYTANADVTLYAQWALFVAVPNPSSSYEPTHIVNGGFETQPTMAGTGANRTPNGTNQGWNTTETGSNCFEWLSNVKQYHNDNLNPIGNRCVEMNADNAATLYQDLYTYGGDVIRWSLAHAVRTKYCGPDEQYIRGDVGAPLYNGNNIVYPTGVNYNINTNINPDTKAIYRYNGITNPTGHTYGFNGQNLENLKLSKSAQASQWYFASGVYIVPESQSVTRFAFVSEDNSSCGNLLDEISFSTLIGDLDATYGDNNSVVIKGYWGETDTSKKLIIDINGTPNEVDMTSVIGKNFVITMTYDNKPSAVKIYHEDYESAACTISVHYSISAHDVTANLANGAYWATFYSNASNYQAPDGTQVFAVNLTGTAIEMTEISDRIVKSGEGVVLKQTTGSSAPSTTITMTPTETAATDSYFSGNSLTGTMTSITNPDYGHIYVLNKGTQGVGFYKLKSGKTIGANKAYLQTTSGAREFFLFGDATGIETIDHSPLTIDHSVYDLQGRRVAQPTKGLYIVRSAEGRLQGKNGKKVIK